MRIRLKRSGSVLIDWLKKAANYKIPFSYTISEEHPKKVSVYEVDSVTQTIHTVGTYMVAAVDITVNCEGLIRANGWTLRARVEHGSQGNIVMGIGDKPVDLSGIRCLLAAITAKQRGFVL